MSQFRSQYHQCMETGVRLLLLLLIIAHGISRRLDELAANAVTRSVVMVLPAWKAATRAGQVIAHCKTPIWLYMMKCGITLLSVVGVACETVQRLQDARFRRLHFDDLDARAVLKLFALPEPRVQSHFSLTFVAEVFVPGASASLVGAM
jgi:hypothetical protein